MKLWIRSQDKLKMLKVDYLEYDFTKIKDVSGVITEYHKIIASYNNDWFSIGDYATKERAIKVLDEIQDLLQNAYAGNVNRIVYQMPEN